MKKILSLTIIALIALIALTTSVSAADVTVNTEADLKNALLTDGTVKLSGDIEITESIRTTTNVTVDLNGFKITGPDDGKANWYAFIVEGGTFTLKDTSTAQTGEIYAKCFGIETKAGTFIMESGKITATKNGGIGAAIAHYGGQVIINGGTLVGSKWAIDAEAFFADLSLEINGGTFEATAVDAVNATDEATIIIGGTNTKEEYKEVVVINKGTFSGAIAFKVATESAGDVTINGGEFSGTTAFTVGEDSKATVTINGGKYSSDVSEYLDSGYAYDEETGLVACAHKDCEYHKEVAATYEKTGTKAYYSCNTCEKWFEDEEATKEITDKDSIVIAKLVKVEEEPTAGGQGTAEQQPAENKKDETPKTGAFDIVLYVLGAIALVSVIGTVKAKKPGKYSK